MKKTIKRRNKSVDIIRNNEEGLNRNAATSEPVYSAEKSLVDRRSQVGLKKSHRHLDILNWSQIVEGRVGGRATPAVGICTAQLTRNILRDGCF